MSCVGIPKNFAGLPHVLVLIVLETGLPGVAITLTVGQLVSICFVCLCSSNHNSYSLVAHRSVKSSWRSSRCSS